MGKIFFDPENEKRPYVAINGVIIRMIDGQEQILLGKRKNAAGAGYYYLPGGHVKLGETLAQGLKREMKEELGIEIEAGRVMWVEEAITSLHHITFFQEAILKGDEKNIENMEPDKCEGWKWFSVDDLPRSLWNTLAQFITEHKNKKRVQKFVKVSKDYIGVGTAGIIMRSRTGKIDIFNKKINLKDVEVLMEKRGKKARNNIGLWELPGGKVEWGETIKATLVREIKEELGIDIKVGMQVCALDEFHRADKQHWIAIAHVCQITKGKPVNKEPGKIDGIRWFSVNKLPDLIAPVTKQVIDEFMIKFK